MHVSECLSFRCRMMVQGYKRPLEEKDLWSLNEEDRSQAVVPQLVRCWDHECNKVKRSDSELRPFHTRCDVARALIRNRLAALVISPRTHRKARAVAVCVAFSPNSIVSTTLEFYYPYKAFMNGFKNSLLLVINRFMI